MSFCEYQRSSRGKEYIAALTENLGGVSAVATLHGGTNPGTWIHPRLAIDVAHWISPKFAIWIDNWVFDTMFKQLSPVVKAVVPSRLFHNQKMILDETQLHHAIIRWFRGKFPGVVIIAGLGENQDTEEKRLDSYAKGYTKGQPDIMVPVQTPWHAGIALELKHPGKSQMVTTDAQLQVLENLKLQGWKTLLTSSYDDACVALSTHMDQRRKPCPCCGRQYASSSTISRHMKRKRMEETKTLLKQEQPSPEMMCV